MSEQTVKEIEVSGRDSDKVE